MSQPVDIMLAGDDWDDPELCEHAVGFLIRDEVFFQEFLFPDFHPSRDRPTPLSAYRRWNPDDFAKRCRSQIPMYKWRVLLCPGGRGTDKTEGAQVRDKARRAIVHRATLHETIMQREDLLDPQHFDPTLALFTEHPLLSLFFLRSDSKDRTIFLRNKSRIFFRFPGLSGGRRKAGGVQGFRAHAIDTDESQHLREAVYKDASHQQLVTATSIVDQQNKGAGRRMLGVHDGVKRTDGDELLVMNAFDGDQDSIFCEWRKMPDGQRRLVDCRWHIASTAIPYMTRQKHHERAIDTGASVEQGEFPAEYQQDVWGRRGRSAEAFFPTAIRRMSQKVVQGWVHLRPSYAQFVREAKLDNESNIVSCGFDFLAGLPVERDNCRYALGIDVATGSDSVIGIFAETRPEQWTWCACITLPGWDNTTAQCFVVDHLVYRYHVDFIGYDRSTVGHSIGDPMMNLSQFRAMDYRDPERFFGIVATEKYVWDERVDPRKLARARNDEERQTILENPEPYEDRILQWYMPTLRSWFPEARLIFPTAEQAPEIDMLLSTITRRFKASQMGTTIDYKPAHPDHLSAVGMFMGAKQQLELMTRRDAPKQPNAQRAKDLRRMMRTRIISPLYR